MKSKLILASIGVIAFGSISVVSCSKDDEMDDFNYNLDVSCMTPKTRSSLADYEPGASQTLGGDNVSPYVVPVKPNECGLWALLSVAIKKGVSLKQPNGKSQRIGYGYPAAQAYSDIKGIATSGTYPVCDVYGKPIEGEGNYNYEGGTIPPSIMESIGNKLGILQGERRYFESYEQLQTYIQNNSLKPGTYIICSESGGHAVVGYGIDKAGHIKCRDASSYSSKLTETDSDNGGNWTLLY